MVSTTEIYRPGLLRIEEYTQSWTTDGYLVFDETSYGTRGIELQVNSFIDSFKYEDRCYQHLLRQYISPDTIVIGPHLTDTIMVAHSSWRKESRPDAIIFRVDDAGWVLTGLAEFKSGKKFSKKSKLEGFERWLKRVRDNPNFIPNVLENIINSKGGAFTLPSSTYIPPNHLVDVLFISPKKEFHYEGDTQFNLQHMHLAVL